MSTGKYILKDGKPFQVHDIVEWGKWFEKGNNERIVKQEKVDDYFVSTVFLALDHNYTGQGEPVLWETMTFGSGEHEGLQWRCSGVKSDALKMHQNAVKKLRALIKQEKHERKTNTGRTTEQGG